VQHQSEFKVHFGRLKVGKHEFDFEVNDSFFAPYEYSLVKKGKIQVHLSLEKQSEMFFSLLFTFDGVIELECHRCLDAIEFPLSGTERTLVKLDSQVAHSDDDDANLILLPTDTYEIDLSPVIYEFINLSLPLRQVCEIVNKDCNPDMVKMIDGVVDQSEAEKLAKETENQDNSPWDALKNLKIDEE